MPIPIRNIYYLLSYAWDGLDQSGVVDVGALKGFDTADLLAHMLIGGASHVLKRGLDRSYVDRTDQLAILRGRINFGESLRRCSSRHRKLACDFAEFEANILHNQIIKTTLGRLACVRSLDTKLRRQLKELEARFAGVDIVILSRPIFRKCLIHRNNAHYRILLQVCELAYLRAAMEEKGGTTTFADFLQDTKMRSLFQKFALNFYRRERPDLAVGGEVIKWDATAETEEDWALLPQMVTDITLRSDAKTWVIDTKFYEEALTGRFDADRLISANLYQIFSYLRNLEKNGGQDAVAEGILLYPCSGVELRAGYMIQGHRIRAVTVNLDNEWSEIKAELLDIVGAAVPIGK